MALIAIASDKGAPGVTTAALALAAVWPRPVLLAECDPAGGDLVYRFPAVGGGHLDPRRGVLSLAVAARRGMQPQQVWEHVQKLHGGLDVLAGVTNAEQGAGLSLLWGPIGKALASLPQADVIADCGRLGADGPLYDLLAEATTVVLVTKVHVADVIRLRDRATAFAAAAHSRGRRNFGVGVVVVTDHKRFRASLGEVQHVLGQANAPATVLGGIAHDTRGADLLSGEWGGNLDRTMLIKTAREVARQLVQGLPPIGPQPAYPAPGPAPHGAAPHGAAPHSPAPNGLAYHGPQQVPAPTAAMHSPADLGAVTLSAPTASDEALRTTFSRIRGRSGRHSAGSGPALTGPALTGPALTGPALTGQPSSEQVPIGQPSSGQPPNGYAGNGYAPVGYAPNGQAVNGQAQPAGVPSAGSYAATQAGAPGQPRLARHAQAGTNEGGTRDAASHEAATREAATREGATREGGTREAASRETGPSETGTREAGTSETGAREARIRQVGSGSFFSRPPMTPLTTSDSQQDPAGRPDPEDSGWGAGPWDGEGSAGSLGSPGPRRSGGE